MWGRRRMNRERAERFACFLLILAIASIAFELLRSAYVAFVNLEYSLFSDYYRYTNMLWNTAHGRPFVFELLMVR